MPIDPKGDVVGQVMHEWKHGHLHSGGHGPKDKKGHYKHKGPKVTDQKQAIAIALSMKRASGQDFGILGEFMHPGGHAGYGR